MRFRSIIAAPKIWHGTARRRRGCSGFRTGPGRGPRATRRRGPSRRRARRSGRRPGRRRSRAARTSGRRRRPARTGRRGGGWRRRRCGPQRRRAPPSGAPHTACRTRRRRRRRCAPTAGRPRARREGPRSACGRRRRGTARAAPSAPARRRKPPPPRTREPVFPPRSGAGRCPPRVGAPRSTPCACPCAGYHRRQAPGASLASQLVSPLRAIDFHVHLPTPDWLDVSMRGYVEAAESYFRSKVARKTLEELAREYDSLDMMAVLLAWDAETATGRPRVPNDLVAEACKEFPKTFIGFGSVDPLKGERAVDELERIAELGLKGVKLHPSLQAFAPNEEQHWPLYERCQDLGLITLFHTGTSGIGAGQPGGQGIRLDYARPIWLDTPAAAFPDMKIIAAHFGYPWHLELLAMALHKTNIYIDISGWSPRYIPTEVLRDMKGRLKDQFLFGSDYPFLQPERCLEELQGLDIPEPVLQKILVENGRRLLAIA